MRVGYYSVRICDLYAVIRADAIAVVDCMGRVIVDGAASGSVLSSCGRVGGGGRTCYLSDVEAAERHGRRVLRDNQ